MKDLSIFARVFKLRDEAWASQLPPGNLLAQAVALSEQADKAKSEKGTRSTRSAITELLRAASAPLPVLDESGLARPAPAMPPKTPDSASVVAARKHGKEPHEVEAKTRASKAGKRKGRAAKKEGKKKPRRPEHKTPHRSR